MATEEAAPRAAPLIVLLHPQVRALPAIAAAHQVARQAAHLAAHQVAHQEAHQAVHQAAILPLEHQAKVVAQA